MGRQAVSTGESRTVNKQQALSCSGEPSEPPERVLQRRLGSGRLERLRQREEVLPNHFLMAKEQKVEQ